MNRTPTDLTGMSFDRLTVIKRAGTHAFPNGRTQSVWLCRCVCGKEKEIGRTTLIQGCTKSCGCLGEESRHNKALPLTDLKLHRILGYMKTRCYNVNSTYYANYGGRGIGICDEWLSDKSKFVKWAKDNGYRDGLTIDRINPNGNYEPTNCRWIPKSEQALNRRNSIRIKIDSKEYSIKELSQITNLSQDTIRARIRYGFSGKEIISTHKNAKVRVAQ